MSHSRDEITRLTSVIDLQAEATEREAARQRWKNPELELDAFALRNEAAEIRRIDR
jgi:hypothetical protein